MFSNWISLLFSFQFFDQQRFFSIFRIYKIAFLLVFKLIDFLLYVKSYHFTYQSTKKLCDTQRTKITIKKLNNLEWKINKQYHLFFCKYFSVIQIKILGLIAYNINYDLLILTRVLDTYTGVKQLYASGVRSQGLKVHLSDNLGLCT